MRSEQNKAAIRYWYLVAGACNVERNAYLRVDRRALGPDSLLAVVTSLRQALPDIHFAIEDQTIEGDSVSTRWRASATRTGAALAVPLRGPFWASGRSIERFADGWLVESHASVELPALFHQLDAAADMA